MKLIYSLILLVYGFALFSCNFKSDHPQANLIKDQSSTGMNDRSIILFANSIERNLENFQRSFSLIYRIGDHSLYVERYTKPSIDRVYYEHVRNGSKSNVLNKYYLKNDSLVLIESNSNQTSGKVKVFKDSRIYLRNNTVFKKEERSASSEALIKKLPYSLVQSPGTLAAEESYFEKIRILDDALEQSNKFEMVFDQVETYPDARYLILKSKIPNSYTASVLVESNNSFVDSLINNSSALKEEKLNFKWKIENNEAIYVPDRDNLTSASGLNK